MPGAILPRFAEKGRTRGLLGKSVSPAVQAEAPVLWCSQPVFGPP